MGGAFIAVADDPRQLPGILVDSSSWKRLRFLLLELILSVLKIIHSGLTQKPMVNKM